MATWIALFRGINVGGKNVLKMADLRESLESIKLKNVRTYIQSGNVVFESTVKSSATLFKKISRQVEEQNGFRPHLLILPAESLRKAVKNNPFSREVQEPRLLHFFFLAQPSKSPDLESINSIRKPTEQFKLTDDVFYFHSPDGFHGSKLGAKVEKLLGVVATARNFATVEKLVEMLDSN